MKFTIGHAQHIGVRHQQQDSFGLAQDTGSPLAVVVADGMGGMAHGDRASATAVEAFLRQWREPAPDTPPTERLRACVEAANREVFLEASAMHAAMEMGTTLVAGAFDTSGLVWASVGDSAIYLLRAGRLRLLNVFHTYGWELDQLADRGIVPRAVVANHPERDALTSFVGIESLRLLDVSPNPVPLQPGDWVLLATDGLFKTLDEQSIVAAVRGEPQNACDTLVRQTLAVRSPYQDNVTVVAIRVENG